jgi:hypothetical protein
MRFNPEQVILFSFALLILFLVAGSLLISPLAWMEAAVHEITVVFEQNPKPAPAPLSPPSFRGKTLIDGLKLSENQPCLRYETVPPALLQTLNSSSIRNSEFEQSFKKYKPLSSDKEAHLADLLARLNAAQDLSAQEWTDLARETASAQGFLRDLTALAETSYPTNAMDAISQKTGNPEILQQSVQMLCLEGFRLAQDNQSAKALEVVASAAKLARSSQIAQMDTQRAQTEAMDMAVNAWSRIVEKQSDTSSLEASLHQMNNLAASQQEALEQVKEPIARDLLSRLSSMSPAEAGSQIERIAPDYLLQKYAAQKQKVLEKMAKISPDDPRIETTRMGFEGEIADLSKQVRQTLDRRKRTENSGISAQSRDPQTAAEEVVQAKLDLLRIKTANLISQKTGNDIQGDIDRLVPRFFAFQPKDPFSQVDFRIDEAKKLPYSVGPDLKDDGARILYDPTNGTISVGDVMIAPSLVLKSH